MSAALQRVMSVEEFLAWEERQESKYEFDGLDVRAMVSVSEPHARIQANLVGALYNRFRGTGCWVSASDFKLRVVGRIRYPDAFIACSPSTPGTYVHDEPVVVFEIVSPSSERIDRFVKNTEYRDTASVQAYVILQQAFAGATVYHRSNGDWVGHEFGAGATLHLPGAAIDLPLDEIYEGVPLAA